MRRIPLSRRSHVTGFSCLESGIVEHESALERDFVILTSFADPKATIVSQPMTIPFEDNGARRRYTPDFSVRWSDGRFELVEVKYWAELRENWSWLWPGFSIAREVARKNDGSFRVVTERSIRGPRLENATRLTPLRRAAINPVAAEQALHAACSLAEPTFMHVVEAMDCDREIALGAVWRLIAQGRLAVDFDAPIRANTLVRVS